MNICVCHSITFEDSKLIHEFDVDIDRKLRLILLDILWYSRCHFGKGIIVTSLVRTDDRTSVHYWGKGGDLRSRCYTFEQLKDIKQYINNNYEYRTPGKHTLMIHDVGRGIHIHVQV